MLIVIIVILLFIAIAYIYGKNSAQWLIKGTGKIILWLVGIGLVIGLGAFLWEEYPSLFKWLCLILFIIFLGWADAFKKAKWPNK